MAGGSERDIGVADPPTPPHPVDRGTEIALPSRGRPHGRILRAFTSIEADIPVSTPSLIEDYFS